MPLNVICDTVFLRFRETEEHATRNEMVSDATFWVADEVSEKSLSRTVVYSDVQIHLPSKAGFRQMKMSNNFLICKRKKTTMIEIEW
jgi:hypothetical protein